MSNQTLPQPLSGHKPDALLRIGCFDGSGWSQPRHGRIAVEIVQGNLWRDADVLESRIRAMKERRDEFPDAFAGGTVDYDGTYEFCFYREEEEERLSEDRQQNTQAIHFEEFTGKSDFLNQVRAAQNYIAEGDIYQVNLARKMVTREPVNAEELHRNLKRLSPTPYAAWLQQTKRQVVSASPECFLRMKGREIITQPIKGTRPRSAIAKEDQRQAEELQNSEKEQAELLMITDLERNDLGSVCEFGSVEVSSLAKLESFPHVHHLVSTVHGRLREDVSHVAALKACFPGGSITGAPKKRAREIIRELEGVERGLYTGAIGWFGANGVSEFSIAIRTVIIEEGVAHFHVGAGIVADSVPEKEYEETTHKAAGILSAAK